MRFFASFILLTLNLASKVSPEDANAIFNYKKQLMSKLLTGYDKTLKPPGVTKVFLNFEIHQILNLMERDQIIILNTWINQNWKDARLVWNPSDYGNLTSIIIPSDKLWAYLFEKY